VFNFFDQIGSSIAPLLAGVIAVRASLGSAIMIISVSAWLICFAFIVLAAVVIPRDIEQLRGELRERAVLERSR
jgi:hypothetical protein